MNGSVSCYRTRDRVSNLRISDTECILRRWSPSIRDDDGGGVWLRNRLWSGEQVGIAGCFYIILLGEGETDRYDWHALPKKVIAKLNEMR